MKNIKFLPHISELLLICVLDKWQDEWKDLFSKIMPKRFWIFFFFILLIKKLTCLFLKCLFAWFYYIYIIFVFV